MECIWASAGVVPYKLCDFHFDCSNCIFFDLVMRGAHVPPNEMNIRGCKFNLSFFYSHNHTWAMVEENAQVRIGIDDFGQNLLGKIQEIILPNKGEKLGKASITVKGRGTVIQLLSPIEGNVVEINEELLREPSLANQSPYGKGWFVLLRPLRLAKNLQRFVQGQAALDWFNEETIRLYCIFLVIYPNVGITFQDGGALNFTLLDSIEHERTKNILEQFFS